MSDCRFGVSPVNYPDPEQLHLLALHFEILGYIPGLLNGLEYLRRTGDFSGDNITRRLL